jgi:hypothetical protein
MIMMMMMQKKNLYCNFKNYYCCSLWLCHSSNYRGNSHFPFFLMYFFSISCTSLPSFLPSLLSLKLTQHPHLNRRKQFGWFLHVLVTEESNRGEKRFGSKPMHVATKVIVFQELSLQWEHLIFTTFLPWRSWDRMEQTDIRTVTII